MKSDDLPRDAGLRRREVQTQMIAAAVGGEWNPGTIPPLLANCLVRADAAVVEFADFSSSFIICRQSDKRFRSGIM